MDFFFAKWAERNPENAFNFILQELCARQTTCTYEFSRCLHFSGIRIEWNEIVRAAEMTMQIVLKRNLNAKKKKRNGELFRCGRAHFDHLDSFVIECGPRWI